MSPPATVHFPSSEVRWCLPAVCSPRFALRQSVTLCLAQKLFVETPECAAHPVGRAHKPGVTFEGDEPAASPALTPPSTTATSAGSSNWLTTVPLCICMLNHPMPSALCLACYA